MDRACFPVNRLCNVSGISARGLSAFYSRPGSRRQWSDLENLAHIKEKSHLSLGSYSRPRMTEESKEISLEAGNRRMDRLIRQHDISVLQTNKHKVAIDDD